MTQDLIGEGSLTCSGSVLFTSALLQIDVLYQEGVERSVCASTSETGAAAFGSVCVFV